MLLIVVAIAAIGGIGLFAFLQRSHGDANALRVGSILGLTGENAAYGIKMRQGLELALEDINTASKGSAKPLDLIIEDSQWDPRLGISIYRKMHDVNGVRLFAAICGSKIALAICESSRNDDVVIVDAISGAPKLTTHGGGKYFRVCASDAYAGQNNVNWALEEGCKSFLIVYVEDEWGSSYKDALVSALGVAGHTAATLPVAVKSRDLRVEAQKAANARPDAVFLVLYANLAVPFIQQARSYGLSSKILRVPTSMRRWLMPPSWFLRIWTDRFDLG